MLNADTYRPRAILLDFYGTIVEEDGPVIKAICRRIACSSPLAPTWQAVGQRWNCIFSQLCRDSFGPTFQLQRQLELASLGSLLRECESRLNAEALSQPLFEYWRRPAIFAESKAVLAQCRLPVCLVSNIDNDDLRKAMKYHGIKLDNVVTSEDCRAYKPRPEVFRMALDRLKMRPDRCAARWGFVER